MHSETFATVDRCDGVCYCRTTAEARQRQSEQKEALGWLTPMRADSVLFRTTKKRELVYTESVGRSRDSLQFCHFGQIIINAFSFTHRVVTEKKNPHTTCKKCVGCVHRIPFFCSCQQNNALYWLVTNACLVCCLFTPTRSLQGYKCALHDVVCEKILPRYFFVLTKVANRHPAPVLIVIRHGFFVFYVYHMSGNVLIAGQL